MYVCVECELDPFRAVKRLRALMRTRRIGVFLRNYCRAKIKTQIRSKVLLRSRADSAVPFAVYALDEVCGNFKRDWINAPTTRELALLKNGAGLALRNGCRFSLTAAARVSMYIYLYAEFLTAEGK